MVAERLGLSYLFLSNPEARLLIRYGARLNLTLSQLNKRLKGYSFKNLPREPSTRSSSMLKKDHNVVKLLSFSVGCVDSLDQYIKIDPHQDYSL